MNILSPIPICPMNLAYLICSKKSENLNKFIMNSLNNNHMLTSRCFFLDFQYFNIFEFIFIINCNKIDYTTSQTIEYPNCDSKCLSLNRFVQNIFRNNNCINHQFILNSYLPCDTSKHLVF